MRRTNSKLDVQRIGPFQVNRMIGKNAAELILLANFSRLHPVFNVSLLMPFVADATGILPESTTTQADFVQDFVAWASFTYVLDYRKLPGDIHEYLL